MTPPYKAPLERPTKLKFESKHIHIYFYERGT